LGVVRINQLALRVVLTDGADHGLIVRPLIEVEQVVADPTDLVEPPVAHEFTHVG
jgi:hypothetical protein